MGISLIDNVSCPTLFIHGENDNLVPPSHSVALFKNCRARKLLITPPGMEHNTNLFTDARFFEDGKQAFLVRKSSSRKETAKDSLMDSSPWFFLCGCPTSRAKQRQESNVMEPQNRTHAEWDP